jgi:hypothetical protein
VDIRIHTVYLLSVLVLWVLVYHAAYWLIAFARDSSLVCWSVGLFGFSMVSLRQPTIWRLLAQLVGGALAGACAVYASLFLLMPPPIPGLDRSASTRAVAVSVPVLLLSVLHLAGIIRERRHPLWGEARVLSIVQRGLATGARIYFTPTGRAFLRERFDVTPAEFMRMVRY